MLGLLRGAPLKALERSFTSVFAAGSAPGIIEGEFGADLDAEGSSAGGASVRRAGRLRPDFGVAVLRGWPAGCSGGCEARAGAAALGAAEGGWSA